MSAIVPWNDPGGTPCCCELNCLLSLPSGPPLEQYRDIELTQTEYSLIVSGGSFLCETSITGSAQANQANGVRQMVLNGSWSSTTLRPIIASAQLNPIPAQQGTRCAQIVDEFGDVQIIEESKNITGSFEPWVSDALTDVVSSEESGSSENSIFEPYHLVAYNNGLSIGKPNQRGMLFRRSMLQSIGYVARYDRVLNEQLPVDPATLPGLLNDSLAVFASMQTASSGANNANFELVMPQRTILVPYVRNVYPQYNKLNINGGVIASWSGQIIKDKATFVPPAP